MGNLFDLTSLDSLSEQFDTLVDTSNVRIERIVSFGHPTPEGEWYDQWWDEWVLLVGGWAELMYDDNRRCVLHAGDWVMIPARVRHRVERVSVDAVWLAVHLSE